MAAEQTDVTSTERSATSTMAMSLVETPAILALDSRTTPFCLFVCLCCDLVMAGRDVIARAFIGRPMGKMRWERRVGACCRLAVASDETATRMACLGLQGNMATEGIMEEYRQRPVYARTYDYI